MIRQTLLTYITAVLAAVGTMAGASSCSVIYEDSECVAAASEFVFTYDMNLKWADAFASEVKSVHVLMFDTDGTLRYQWRINSGELRGGNTLAVEVEPGDYDVLVWAGDYHQGATLNPHSVAEPLLADHHLRLERGEGHIVCDDFEAYYHCLRRVTLPYAAPSAPHREVFNLTKDTNNVRVVLQQLGGDNADMSGLTVTITDANGWLAHDNSLRPDATLTYRPWYRREGSVDVGGSPLGALTTEFTVSRLMRSSNPTVTVTKPGGEKVLQVSLNDYALLVKGQYKKDLDDQEYLDRQDEYNMTFFLDEGLNWIDAQVIINDWIIVLDETDLSSDAPRR